MNSEFWILVAKDMTNAEITKELNDSYILDNVMRFKSKEEALEYRHYGDVCDEDDMPKKVKLTFEITE